MLNIHDIPLDNSLLMQKETSILLLDGYTVTLNGRSAQVRRCRESALPFNRQWPGTQRVGDQTKECGFVSFSADEPVKVAVSGNFPAEGAVLRPLASGVIPAAQGEGKLEFTLDKPGYYVLEFVASPQYLYFLYDAVSSAPAANSVQRYFGPGLHFPGKICLNSGDSIYIDPAAIVFGSIYGKGVHGVKIFGGGTLHSGMEERFFEGFYADRQGSSLKFYDSSDIRISGIIVQDSPCWTTSFFGCSDIHIDHLKILGQWKYNTDGIDLVNTDHVEITNSLVHSFDDTIVLKGVDFAMDDPWITDHSVSDIVVKGCVLWCGWGRTLELGIETGAPEFARILFENCDLIHNSAVCLDLRNGNHADYHDVTFRDIRIEYQAYALPEVFQNSDDQVYRPEDSWFFQEVDNPNGEGKIAVGVPMLIFADNHRFIQFGKANYGVSKYGSTYDILFENIAVTTEPGVPEKLPVRIANLSEESVYRNFTLRNLTVNGKRLTGPGDVAFETEGRVENIVWE